MFTEYETFLKNRNKDDIIYAHADSVNVFHLIDQILGQSRNNPLHKFDHQSEITSWLREQWSGLFKEMLDGRSEQRQLSSLADQVEGLSEINNTLKRYLEKIITSVSKGDAAELIESEDKRLAESKRMREFSEHLWVRTVVSIENKTDIEGMKKFLSEAKTIDDVAVALEKIDPESYFNFEELLEKWAENVDSEGKSYAKKYINSAREILGLPPIDFSDSSQQKKGSRKKKAKKAE